MLIKTKQTGVFHEPCVVFYFYFIFYFLFFHFVYFYYVLHHLHLLYCTQFHFYFIFLLTFKNVFLLHNFYYRYLSCCCCGSCHFFLLLQPFSPFVRNENGEWKQIQNLFNSTTSKVVCRPTHYFLVVKNIHVPSTNCASLGLIETEKFFFFV